MIFDHIDEEKIRADTEKYWKYFKEYQERPEKRLEYYIKNLLPEEIESYEQRHSKQFRHHSPVKHLVLLVGYSFEPLLQSVCFLRPECIIPVISKEYGKNRKGQITTGSQIYDRLSEAVEILHEQRMLRQAPELYPAYEQFEPVPSRPEDVFQYLVKHLIPVLDQEHSVVIDITGAKKSMVAGAFLFGAYANIPITYVDFEEYDEVYGRPYGYTMEITELENPYHAFSLHRWKRVENLHRQHAFKSARVEVEEIIESMERTGNSYFNDTQKSAARKMKRLLKLYELWENGEYHKAGIVQKELNDENIYIPSAVNVLREIWPSSEKKDKDFLAQVTALESGSEPIFVNKKGLINYIHDELAKIKRLVESHNDYRSAFQRAGGLNDTLFSAKFNILWYEDFLYLKIANGKKATNFFSCSEVEPGSRNILAKLFFSTFKVKKLIYNRDGFTIVEKLQNKKSKYIYTIKPRPEMPEFEKFFTDDEYKRFRDMRNKAVHFALSPSKEDTMKALNFLYDDVRDFMQNWAKLLGEEKVETSTTPPEWDELCKLCGIDFLPPSKEAENDTVPAGR